MTERAASILPFVRKHKPRTVPADVSAPTHHVLPVPRAIVQPTTQYRHNLQRRSVLPPSAQHSRHQSPLPDFDRAPNLRAVRPSAATSVAAAANTKPRKRFRKKLSGLFGDQTDLKKRMSKLLRDTDTSQVILRAQSGDEPKVSPEIQSLSRSLPATKTIIDQLAANSFAKRLKQPFKLDVPSPVDSFDFEELTQKACKVMGSPEKLANVRKTMGTLSPRSNDRFLATLQLGKPLPHIRKKERTTRVEKISPPIRPLPILVDPVGTDQRRAPKQHLSPVSVDCTGAPAVLRCRARRMDRGYRCADVLRARLQSGAVVEAALASPTSTLNTSKLAGLPDTTGSVSAVVHRRKTGRERGRMPPRSSLQTSIPPLSDADRAFDWKSSHGSVSSEDQKTRRVRKRRRNDVAVRDDGHADPHNEKKRKIVDDTERPKRPKSKGKVDAEENAHDPLKMLMEAAETARTASESQSRESNESDEDTRTRTRVEKRKAAGNEEQEVSKELNEKAEGSSDEYQGRKTEACSKQRPDSRLRNESAEVDRDRERQ